jgi:2,4-dienoyl-CoA reductase-like NADH-dependent reductase (Old Yellow Enzyme family)/thioredoxin reductase
MGINNFSRGAGMPMDMDVAHFPDFDLYEPASQNYLIQLADAIHFYDSIACMGFFIPPHANYIILNEKGEKEIVEAENPLGPMPGSTPEEAADFARHVIDVIASYDEETLGLIADSYAQQCAILERLGFDMVSIHMAYRGQLPAKFLSPLTNKRTDKFGGSAENRARFPLMILSKIREVVGSDFIIELLLSGEEPEGGYTVDDAVDFLKRAEDYVDIVQVRAAEADPNHPTGFNLEETPFLDLAAKIKKSGVEVLVSSVGGWQDPVTAESAISSGKVDIIALARAWVSNPDYGNLIYDDKADDIVPCLRCNKCHGRGPKDPFVSICSVNPLIGIEHRLNHLLTPVGKPKSVAVVGGGPAGMKAAIDLCDRGHRVTLFEANDSLGGMIRHADFVDFKWPLKRFKEFLIQQVGKRDIEIKLGCSVTPKELSEKGYEAIVVAIGAVPALPPISGIDGENVRFATEVFSDADMSGYNTVIIGGGEVGVEAGMYLAKKGHNITVLEMRDELAADSTMIHYRSMFQEAWEAIPNFGAILNVRCTEITADHVTYTDMEGTEKSISADNVIVSAGMKSKREEALSYYGIAKRVYLVGDCRKPGTVQHAMRSAFAVASTI